MTAISRLRGTIGVCFLLCAVSPLFAADNTPASQSLTPLWRQSMDGTMLGPPLVEAGLITVVSDGGTLRSYSTLGNQLWTFNAHGRLSPHLGRSPEGTTYICRNNGVFIAINRSGRELWRRELGEPIIAPPISGWDGRLFLFTQKHIHCYNAAGYPLWRQNLEAAPSFDPVMNGGGGFTTLLENGNILEGNAFGRITTRELPPESVFQQENHPESQQRKDENNPARKPPRPALVLVLPLERETLLLLYNDGSAVLLPRGLDAASATTNATLLPKIGGTPVAAASRENRAAVMLSGGKLVLVEGGSGAGNGESGPDVLWSAETHTGTVSPETVKLIYNERGIYVLSKTGITGFSEKGEKILSFSLRNISGLPALGEDGTLYAGGNDWILYAFHAEGEERPAPKSAGAGARKNYGTADPRLSTLEQYPYVFEENDISRDLREIDRLTRAGTTGEYERLTIAYLMEIATGLREHTLPRVPGSAPISPYYRAEALRLLGYIGSRETIPFLAYVCFADPEPAVKAAAAAAIGRIGVDPEGTAFRAFTNMIYPPSPTQDDRVLL
ncbi:MAG: PQQ-binding-like beta-propeller repeat protein, partial [Treponema sp.]|nr:PQQ-binding-like beta-propeller repeat protein [Treponema sp.]